MKVLSLSTLFVVMYFAMFLGMTEGAPRHHRPIPHAARRHLAKISRSNFLSSNFENLILALDVVLKGFGEVGGMPRTEEKTAQDGSKYCALKIESMFVGLEQRKPKESALRRRIHGVIKSAAVRRVISKTEIDIVGDYEAYIYVTFSKPYLRKQFRDRRRCYPRTE